MTEKEIIELVVAEYLSSGQAPLRDRFRADHPDEFDSLDQLESSQVLKCDSEGRYEVGVRLIRRTRFWLKEKELAEQLLRVLAGWYRDNLRLPISRELLLVPLGPIRSQDKLDRAVRYLNDVSFLSGFTRSPNGEIISVAASEQVLRHKSIEDKIDAESRSYYKAFGGSKSPAQNKIEIAQLLGQSPRRRSVKDDWAPISQHYGLSRKQVIRKLRFIGSITTKRALLRDIVHAHGCLEHHFYKSALVLSGGVIEEIIRQKLISCKVDAGASFSDHIKNARESKIFKNSIASLSDSIRDFRNHVHVAKESEKKHAISRATASIAVSAIFTVLNDI